MTNPAFEISRILQKGLKEIIVQDTDPRRFFFLRPSSFPFCGFHKVLNAKEDLELQRSNQLMSEYFTSVGTATHNAFQKFLGRTGHMIGDWYCPHCRKLTSKCATYRPCKVCGYEDMQYHELEVWLDNTLVGHVDGVFRLEPAKKEKSRHILIDFKTSSMKKVTMAKSPFPYPSNQAQIEKYVPLVENNFGLKLEGWGLIYLARDLPAYSGVKICYQKMSEASKAKHMKQVKKWVKLFRRSLKAKTREQFEVLEKHKLCEDQAHHDRMFRESYEKCPYAGKCFTKPETLIDKLVKTKKVFPIIQHAPDNIREELEI